MQIICSNSFGTPLCATNDNLRDDMVMSVPSRWDSFCSVYNLFPDSRFLLVQSTCPSFGILPAVDIVQKEDAETTGREFLMNQA